jgi:RNA polymerase sigma factor (sigma-70 family)
MHLHARAYVDAIAAERRATAAAHRRRAEGKELNRLVRAAAERDPAAWSTLVDLFDARIRAVARAHRLAADDVDDVVQITWLRLLEHAHVVRQPCAIQGWLSTTARRESLRLIGKRQRERPAEDDALLDRAVSPVDEQRIVSRERRAALAAAVQRLSVRQQRVLAAVFGEHPRSYADIGDEVDLPVGSIGPTRGRALAQLRRDEALMSVVAEA